MKDWWRDIYEFRVGLVLLVFWLMSRMTWILEGNGGVWGRRGRHAL